jgi:hypothetical protein
LFTFPNVLTSYNGALPQVNYGSGNVSVDSIAKDVACNGTPGSVTNIKGQPLAAPYALPVPGVVLPVFGGTNGMAPLSTYQNGLNYLAYSDTTGHVWTTTYQITPFLSDYYDPTNTSSGGLKTSSELVQAVGYGAIPSSGVVGTPGCLTYTFGVDGTGSGSNFGNTYFAGAIYSAQAALAAQAAANPNTQSALIFLSDGQANASFYSKSPAGTYGASSSTNQYVNATEFPEGPANSEVGPSSRLFTPTSYTNPVPQYYTPAKAVMPSGFSYYPEYDQLNSTSGTIGNSKNSAGSKGTYPDWNDQCQQAIVAAQFAANAANATRVYAVAYGSESSGCSNGWNVGVTDTTLVVPNSSSLHQPFTAASGVLPCTVMEDIASSWDYFYSDNQQQGNVNLGCTDQNHTTVSLQSIFLAIKASFSTPRLISNNAI